MHIPSEFMPSYMAEVVGMHHVSHDGFPFEPPGLDFGPQPIPEADHGQAVKGSVPEYGIYSYIH